MIQRIQSIFLLLAGAASFGLFGAPFATTPEAVDASGIFQDGVFNLEDSLALLIFFVIAGALSLLAIFLFRNRKTQMLVTRFAFIINLIGLILGIVLFMQDSGQWEGSNVNDGLGLYLPIVACVLLVLALRYIQKDEKLVRSSDRLR